MSARPAPVQEYATSRNGRRYPLHTRGLGGQCGCNGCHQRRYWTPARRRARSAQLRQQYADGIRQPTGEHNRRRPHCWTPEQDDALRELVGQHDLPTIARLLTERFGWRRSEHAVKHRLLRLGISRLDVRPLSTAEVGRIFGISRGTVLQRFVKPGRLVGQPWRGGPRGVLWRFSLADVETLIREHPEAYDPDRLRDPGLRALAVAVARRRPRLSTTEVAEQTGIDTRTLAGWFARGLVPSATKVRSVLPGAGGAWLVDVDDLPLIRSLPSMLAARRRAASAARSCPLTGSFLRAGELPSAALRAAVRLIDRAEAFARLRPIG